MKNIKRSKGKIELDATDSMGNFYPLENDFIPYTFHYDESTIITKNLQLLQIIKIDSLLNRELHGNAKTPFLRELLRKAILEHAKSDDFAFWIHTIRRKINLKNDVEGTSELVKFVNDKWDKENKIESQFVNELYITVLIKGTEIKGKEVAFKYFTPKRLNAFLESKLEKAHAALSSLVEKIVKTLEHYSPRCLSIIERNEVHYSELLEFFHKILNLTEIQAPVEEVDISDALNISKMALGINKLIISNYSVTKSVAVLSLKNYLETEVSTLDEVLGMPFEFIIYQAFDFINISEVEDKYKHQYNLLKTSGDTGLIKIFDLSEEDFNVENEVEARIKYGESQVGVIILSDTEEQIESETKAFVKSLQNVGFVAIRDDVMMEDTFFSSLPGNFFYLRRMQPLLTKKIGGFASIDSYPVGKRYNNLWGDAICLFKTLEKLPYFFNFHDESKLGHTIFFGKEFDVQKNAIINFLELQCLKYDGINIINLDFGQNTKLLNILCGEKYETVSLKPNENTLLLNPCQLLSEENTRELGFIAFENFLRLLLAFNKNLTAGAIKYLQEKIMPFVKKNFRAFTTLEELARLIKNEKVVKIFFTSVLPGGTLHHIFSGPMDILFSSKKGMLSINVAGISPDGIPLKIFFEYFLSVVSIIIQNSKKTIIKIDNFFKIAKKIRISKARIIKLLNDFSQKNALFIFSESYNDFRDYEVSPEDPNIMDLISTQGYSPAFANYNIYENELTGHYLNDISKFTNLSSGEKNFIIKHAFDTGYFCVKHAQRIACLEFSNSFSPFIHFFLASRSIEDDLLIKIKAASNLNERFKAAEDLFQRLSNK